MAEGNTRGGRSGRLLAKAIERLDRSFWARDDDIAQRMDWQIFRARYGRRRYRDLRFDVLIIVRETRARKKALALGASEGTPSSGRFNRG